MVTSPKADKGGPGRYAPAPFFAALISVLAPAAAAAQGQPAQPAQPAQAQLAQADPGQVPPLDPITTDKLLWSTLAALDHANVTGNYSVLRDLGSPSFQADNSAATLANVFEGIRTRRLDISNALIAAPSYQIRAITQAGVLRLRGHVPVRPTGIAFDLLYQNIGGQWRLLGISVGSVDLPVSQAAPPRR